ncbi:T9SS type B sorting domain-containing protein [Mucilaginibacter pallidiroseus]|uniref:T9SS type B sorting domain-containing protein n=1 Tax=Mucilaginibacter pallidiroseus TaxID=2599295 RepID=A0A563U3G2_9SPHI|nr:gliding motility-associated C-terminal domain-containing protein [Mucilaginibacter pallidiroseus]TWR25886.1 T9SS type B sorting domain-containing protein [Mucilaginibacter pallidiroseus]
MYRLLWLSLCLCTLVFTLVCKATPKHDNAGSVNISAENNPPCPGTFARFYAVVTRLGPNIRYQWRVNNSPINATTASFNADNSLAIAPGSIVDCVVTDLNTGEQVASNKIDVRAPFVQFDGNVSIYSFSNGINQNRITACKNAFIELGTAVEYNTNDPDIQLKYVWRINGNSASNNNNTPGQFSSSLLQNGDVITCAVTMTSRCRTTQTIISNAIAMSIIEPGSLTIAITSDDDLECLGAKTSFKAAVTGLGTFPEYKWTVNGGKVGDNLPTFSSSTLQTNDVVRCEVVSYSSCGTLDATSNEIVITGTPIINSSVSITSSAANNVINDGQAVTFTANASYKTGVSYQWYVNSLPDGTNSPTFTSSRLTLGDKVRCEVKAPGNCILPQTAVSNEILIITLKPLVIPNTFTPNADGINDRWNIIALLAYPQCTIDIFNRNGALVYHSLGYINGWDGNLQGKPLPPATYYYVIKTTYNAVPLSGYISLVR